VSSLFNISLPKPKDWQDFERKTRELFACVLADPNAQMNGRSGQPQNGVDIWGYRNEDRSILVGVQCKKSGDEIEIAELEAELEKAKGFRPLISEFILATTAPRDTKIQRIARELTERLSRAGRPIRVAVWGWEDLEEQAAKYADAWKAFDPTYNPFAEQSANRIERRLESLVAVFKGADEIKEQELLRGRQALMPARQPAYVDTTRLPETAYERLVGREAILHRLDSAWPDANINIISLVAEGGAGKSALINEWIKRMQADAYSGAEVVLGWSFYSQGSTERATSAEEFLDWSLDKLGIKLAITSASTKADAIAEAMMRRRVLLFLDGVEPLQHGPGPRIGHLRDMGLRTLLRRFAAIPPGAAHGLIVLTSRLAVKDIARWQNGAALVVDIERLSAEGGAALLRDNGVCGTDEELESTALEFGGHPLALGLLASFLQETQTGDVRRRDHVRNLLADTDNPGHDHARRVLESYEKEWLVGQPVLLEIMYIVGLFDRPANEGCLGALRSKPAIVGLSDKIVGLTDAEWHRAISRLREVRLLAPPDRSAPNALDTHPLVREWFGERLKRVGEAWYAAHSRLFDYLRRTTKEGQSPTLEQLAPLYQAVIHGCKSRRYRDALKRVYDARICRNVNGSAVFYASTKLCAFETNLAAISWFFERPYTSMMSSLTSGDQAWLFNEAGHCLGAQGRFAEALAPLRAALAIYKLNNVQPHLAIGATNLSEAEVMVGDIEAALSTSEKMADFNDVNMMLTYRVGPRAVRGAVMHAFGAMQQAETLFVSAEQMQKSIQPEYSYLYSLQGFHFCDFLLEKGEYRNVLDRADKTLKWSVANNFPRDVALDKLNLARAKVGLASASTRDHSEAVRGLARDAPVLFETAVRGLRSAGEARFVVNGLLARAAFRRSVGDWDGVVRDLDEVEEIAEPGPMRLFLCDMALERARFAFARNEGFAPLNGFFDGSPQKFEMPSESERKNLHYEATKQLVIVANYIEKCTYHRRKGELAELEAVLRDERTFASLAPRV
jgi:tetratricopeptide (TPR) repeat protein